MYDVIIPTRNEEKTIGGIVNTFVMHPEIGSVIVACDLLTTDNTVKIATEEGACAIKGRVGKGQNIMSALNYVETEMVILCDGDIEKFQSRHIDAMINDIPEKKKSFIIGVPDIPIYEILHSQIYRDNPQWVHNIFSSWEWVSGERVVPTSVLYSTVLHGYLAEVQINQACRNAGFLPVFRHLHGVVSHFRMGPLRMEQMQKDRLWGEDQGVLPRR
jgi:hypothetical protein